MGHRDMVLAEFLPAIRAAKDQVNTWEAMGHRGTFLKEFLPAILVTMD